MKKSSWMRRTALLLGSMLLFSMAQAQADAAELDASPAAVARWTAFVDKVAQADPKAWRDEALAGHQAQRKHFRDVHTQLATADAAAWQQAHRTGRLLKSTALRIFQVDSFPTPSESTVSADSVAIIWHYPSSPLQASDIEMVTVYDQPYSPVATLHFFQQDCYLGSSKTYFKYGLETGGGKLGGGMAAVWSNCSLESGTGIWENEWHVYTAHDQHLVAAGWIPLEINLTNPCLLNRFVSTRIVSKNPLTIQYDWEIRLGYRYRTARPIFSGKTKVRYDWDPTTQSIQPAFLSPNLNADKLLSLSLISPQLLFVHAWAAELKAALASKSTLRRREVIEFLTEAPTL